MPSPRSVLLESTMVGSGPVFAMTAGTSSGVAVLAVSGDLDQLAADHFDQALAAVLYDPVAVLVVDLTDTTFLSSCAMSTLIRVHDQMRVAGGEVVVVAHGPATARPLHLIGLSDVFTIVDSIDNVLDGPARTPAHSGPAGRSPAANTIQEVPR